MSAKLPKLWTAALLAAVCMVSPAILATPSQAVPAVGADPAVITEWNAIAARTIFTESDSRV